MKLLLLTLKLVKFKTPWRNLELLRIFPWRRLFDRSMVSIGKNMMLPLLPNDCSSGNSPLKLL